MHATQQAFLEAHELAFAYFGGVFRKLRYENLTSAVKKILRGHRREETARFVAFRSHWRLEAESCTSAEPHEKGGIEGEAGSFRRNHWVPVPEAAELADLNGQLLNACQQDEYRMIAGREQTVGAGMVIEREHLLPLATEGADFAQTSFPTVNGLGCVKVMTNAYSVPLPAGTQVQAKAYASRIELWHSGRCVARHERCYRRQQQILDLEHYLDVLYRKPGALAGSKLLEEKRQAGQWPPSFDRIWEALMERHGKQSGTRQMIDLLKLSQKHGQPKLEAAVESALSNSCYDTAAVQHLLNRNRPAAHGVRGHRCRCAGAIRAAASGDVGVRSAPDHGGRAMSHQMAQLQEATIKAQCKTLRMPMIASQFSTLAEQAIREKKSHVGYLEALLLAEIEERARNTIERRTREAHLPRVKTLDEFDYTQSPNVTDAKMRDLAEGGYIERAEPVLFIGECGIGKTHLLAGLCVAACRQKRRVRFTTAAGLVNELVEAKHQLQLRRVMARWSRYDLIAIDEVGYVPLAEVGAEFLFQVVAERAERAAVVLTTNLPFSEWAQVIPSARLCRALLDRITDRAHILETGTESYRFHRTADKQKKGAKPH